MNVSISRDGKELGEWPQEEVRSLYTKGKLLPTDYYWKEGMTEWAELSRMIKPPPPDVKTTPLSETRKATTKIDIPTDEGSLFEYKGLKGSGANKNDPIEIIALNTISSAWNQNDILDTMFGKAGYDRTKNQRLYSESPLGLPGNGDLCETIVILNSGAVRSVWFDLHMVTRIVSQTQDSVQKAPTIAHEANSFEDELKQAFDVTANCQRYFILALAFGLLVGGLSELLRPYHTAFLTCELISGIAVILSLVFFFRFEIRLYGWIAAILICAGVFFLSAMIPLLTLFIILIPYCIGARLFKKTLREYDYRLDWCGRVRTLEGTQKTSSLMKWGLVAGICVIFVSLFAAVIALSTKHGLLSKSALVASDNSEAASLRISAENGDMVAARQLGFLYLDGKGVSKDSNEALKWLGIAANHGDKQAELNLGYLYANGQGVSKDLAQALSWYQKAADQGDYLAQYALGAMYQYGDGVTQDYRQAYSWYQKAADQGYALAQDSLGSLYEHGDGVKQDSDEAFTWYQKAADQGYSGAQYHLGSMYYAGQGVTQDYGQALNWFQKSADQGHAEAENNLGVMYDRGLGVPQEDEMAYSWYSKAAAQGNVSSQASLGYMYENGKGTAKDYNEALIWYQKAADQGDAGAQYDLGCMYGKGEGVEKNYSQAFSWINKSAMQGFAKAQYVLGVSYEHGIGVTKNVISAKEWYQKAADQGQTEAQAALIRLNNQ